MGGEFGARGRLAWLQGWREEAGGATRNCNGSFASSVIPHLILAWGGEGTLRCRCPRGRMEEGHALIHTVQLRCMRDRDHAGIPTSASHRAMVGDHLHVTGALGSLESLREWAGEVGHDMAWAEGGRLQQPLPSSGGVDEEGRDPHRSPQPTQGMPGGGLHDGGGLALGMTARPLKPGGFQPGILQVCRLLLSSHDCIFFPVPHSDDFPVAYLPALMQADADHHSCVAHLFAFPYAGGCGPPPSGDQAVAGRWPDAAARARLLCARVHAGSVQVRNQCFLAWGLYALRVNTLQSHIPSSRPSGSDLLW